MESAESPVWQRRPVSRGGLDRAPAGPAARSWWAREHPRGDAGTHSCILCTMIVGMCNISDAFPTHFCLPTGFFNARVCQGGPNVVQRMLKWHPCGGGRCERGNGHTCKVCFGSSRFALCSRRAARKRRELPPQFSAVFSLRFTDSVPAPPRPVPPCHRMRPAIQPRKAPQLLRHCCYDASRLCITCISGSV